MGRPAPAVFGSYDDSPAAPGVVSRFRNLLHHHVHQRSPGPATTFWTGLGAVRRDAFHAVGGFDSALQRDAMEDVDLGMRLAARGGRVVLDPALQACHLKRWTLRDMVATDLLQRGVPWVRLLARRHTSSTALNLGWSHRTSAGASAAGVTALVTRRRTLALGSALALLALNHRFYALLWRHLGIGAAAGIALHIVHLLTAVASVPLGLTLELVAGVRRRGRGRRLCSPAGGAGTQA